MSFKDKIEQSKKSEFVKKGGWFKFVEGTNKIRVLSEPEPFYEDFNLGICYTGCGFQGSPKALAYIFDHADAQIKLMRMPYTIAEYIGTLESDEDYNFDAFPMPYGLTIEATGAGTKEVEYKVTPRPVRQAMPDAVIAELQKKTPVAQLIEKMKEDNAEKHRKDGTMARLQQKRKDSEDAADKAYDSMGGTKVDYPPNDGAEINFDAPVDQAKEDARA